VFGLSAISARPLAFAPTQAQRELVMMLTKAVSLSQLRTRSSEYEDADNRRREALRYQAAMACRPYLDALFAEWSSEGKVNVFEVEQTQVDELLILTDDYFASIGLAPHSADARIVSETISAGGTMIATSNMRTIDHDGLNRGWARQGHNEPLICTLDALSKRLVADPFRELCVMATMCKSAAERPMRDDMRSLTRFVGNLQAAEIRFLSRRAHLELLQGRGREAIEKAKRWMRTPGFRRARSMESGIQAACRKALEQARLVPKVS